MRRAGALLCTAIALLLPRPAVPEERALAIVVHPERAAALDIEDVARIYLRKRRFWGDGTPIVALNREPARTCSEYVTRAADSARSIAPEKGAALTEPFYRNPPPNRSRPPGGLQMAPHTAPGTSVAPPSHAPYL